MSIGTFSGGPVEPDRDRPEPAESRSRSPDHEAVSPGTVRVTALTCLPFVVLADILFYGHPVGWTIGAFGLLLLGVLLLWERRFPRSVPGLIVVLATASLFLSCLGQPAALAVALGGLGLVTTALLVRVGWTPDPALWLIRWMRFAAVGWTRMFADFLRSRQTAGEEGAREARAGRNGAKNWLVPLLLGAVFLGLFGIANPIIAGRLKDAVELLRSASGRLPSAGRIVFWVLAAMGVWALLRFRTGTEAEAGGEPRAPVEEARSFFSPGLVLRCLVVFNALFAVQTVMDVRYLWGGAALPEGMTYAGYAHRGAYPLVFAALLAGLFVLVAFGRHRRSRAMSWARGLVYLWLAQNVLLVVSAAWRLRLYVDTYSLTRLRTAAAVWMLLVVCGLIWIVARLVFRRSGRWLVGVNLLTALVVLYACSFVNFDGLIARFNVSHSGEMGGGGPSLDVRYLEELGPEALPALLRFSRAVEYPEARANARRAVSRLRRRLQRKLADWRGWSLRRRRLAAVVSPAQDP